MRRIGIVLAVLMLGCGGPPAPRNLQAFTELSRAHLATSSPRELTGLDPVKEWALLLWVERGAADAARAPHDAPLFLNGVTALSVDEARELARHPGSRLFLPDLATLDAPTAAALASGLRRHEIYLDGLVRIDPPTARALVAGRPRSLSFAKIEALDAESATALAGLDGSLRLDGLRTLSPELAGTLARWKGWGEHVILALGGLSTLDAAVARQLAACRGWGMSLGGLQTLAPDAAREIANLDIPYLALDGITAISPETAAVIATWRRKFLTLDGMTSIPDHVRSLVESGCEATSFRSLPRDASPAVSR